MLPHHCTTFSASRLTTVVPNAKDLYPKGVDQLAVFQRYTIPFPISRRKVRPNGSKESVIGAAKIMDPSEKKSDFAKALRSLSLVFRKQDDWINSRKCRKSAYVLFKKSPPSDLHFTDKELDKSRLALIQT